MPMSNIINPFARPLYVMTKPAGAHCNLACDYCYYLEKQKLYQDGEKHVMSDQLTEVFIREYIQSQFGQEVNFTWHGGEPMIRPLDYYKKVVRWQRQYAGGKAIFNCIQTNGTMLTPEWCRFLHDEGWLVGLSIDGPQDMHDAYRMRRNGGGTWEKVMKGVEMLDRYGVEWNAMAVVNDITAARPLDFYRFFRDELECMYLQFTPVVERIHRHADGRHLAHVMDGEEYGLVILKSIMENGEELLSTLDSDEELDEVYEQWKAEIRMQGVELEQYLSMSGMTEEDIRNELKEKAMYRASSRLALEGVAEAEGLKATKAAMTMFLSQMATQYGVPMETLEESLPKEHMDALESDVRIRKALQFIKDHMDEE